MPLSPQPPPDLGQDWTRVTGTEVTFGTLWHPRNAHWPRLVRGQRIATSGREWRVTEIDTAPDGDETYHLEPAEVIDARIAAERPSPYRAEILADEPTRCFFDDSGT